MSLFIIVLLPEDLQLCKRETPTQCFPVKFAKISRTSPAVVSQFCSRGCVRIVIISNVKCISNQYVKWMYNVWSIVWSCIPFKIMPELVVNRSSKIMLTHALLSLLVFNHGFIQIRFSIFEIFCFCFMISKYYLILWNFARYVYSVNAISFFIDEKRTQ